MVKPGLISFPQLLFSRTRVALVRSNPISNVSQKHSFLNRKNGRNPMSYKNNHHEIKIPSDFKTKPT